MDRRTKAEFVTEEITKYMDLLKANGYDIIIRDFLDYLKYFTAHKDGKFFHFYFMDLAYTWSFSAIYYPSRENGDGRRLFESSNLTLENAKRALNWEKPNGVRPFKSVDEYLTAPGNTFGNVRLY